MSSIFIRKTLFEVETNSPQKEAIEKVNRLFEESVLPAMERVSELLGGEDWLINQSLEIDLGEVAKEDLADAVERALYRLLEGYHLPLSITQGEYALPQGSIATNFILEYLQRPLMPWGLDSSAHNFPQQIQSSLEELWASDTCTNRLLSLLGGSVEICKRFFEMPFQTVELKTLIEKCFVGSSPKESDFYTEVTTLLGSYDRAAPSFFKEVSFYLLSRLLSGGKTEKAKSLTLVLLFLMRMGEANRERVLKILHLEGREKLFTLYPSEIKGKYPFEGTDEFGALTPYTSKTGEADYTMVQQNLKELSLLMKSVIEGKASFAITEIELETSLEALLATLQRGKREGLKEERFISPISSSLEKNKELAFNNEFLHYSFNALMDKPLLHIEKPLKRNFFDVDNRGFIKLILDPLGKFPAKQQERYPSAKRDRGSIKKEKRAIFHTEETERDILMEDIEQISYAVSNLWELSPNERERIPFEHSFRMHLESIVKTQPTLTERIPIYNAGLVLFRPYLLSFFDKLELLRDRREFRSVESQMRAAHLLHFLSGAKEAPWEHFMLLNKLLCGINIFFPIGGAIIPLDTQKQEIANLLKATIRNWDIIKNTSISGFQETFIRRRGLLERSQEDWILRVETKGVDILLNDIPWDIHTLSFPWNDFVIYVDWKL